MSKIAVLVLVGMLTIGGPAMAQAPRVLQLKLFGCEDPQGIGGQVFTLLVPVDWRCQGGLTWPLRNPAMPAELWFRASGPTGIEGLEIFPSSMFFWSDNPFTLQMNPQEYFGSPVARPVSASDYAQTALLRAFRGNVQNLRVVDAAPVPDILEKTAGIPGVVDCRHDAVKLRLEYEIDGQEVEEDIYCVTYYLNFYIHGIAGVSTNTNWGARLQYGFRAPRGQLDAYAPLLKTMGKSFKPNQQWFATYENLCGWLIRNQIQKIHAIHEIGRYVAQVGREIRQENLDSWYARQAIQDQTVKNFCNHILGIQPYQDPFRGEAVDLPNNYQYAWANPLGGYIMTDDPNYNPNSDPNVYNQTWQLLQTTQ